MLIALGCKFTPLGFETSSVCRSLLANVRVNLPRWGLKRSVRFADTAYYACKFTPLGFETFLPFFASSSFATCKFTPLGFETFTQAPKFSLAVGCKFTPLGFETNPKALYGVAKRRVNLPRWGLKLIYDALKAVN